MEERLQPKRPPPPAYGGGGRKPLPQENFQVKSSTFQATFSKESSPMRELYLGGISLWFSPQAGTQTLKICGVIVLAGIQQCKNSVVDCREATREHSQPPLLQRPFLQCLRWSQGWCFVWCWSFLQSKTPSTIIILYKRKTIEMFLCYQRLKI